MDRQKYEVSNWTRALNGVDSFYMHLGYLNDIITAQKQPQPQQQNNHNCSWVETK